MNRLRQPRTRNLLSVAIVLVYLLIFLYGAFTNHFGAFYIANVPLCVFAGYLWTEDYRPVRSEAGISDLEVMLMTVGILMLLLSIVALFQDKDGIGAFIAFVAILPFTIARTMRRDDEDELRLSPMPIPPHMYERNGHERGLIRDGLVHLSLAAFCCIGAVVLCFTSPWQAAFELSIFAVFFGACGLAISLHDKPKKLANRQEKQEV